MTTDTQAAAGTLPAAAVLPQVDVWQDIEPLKPTRTLAECIARDPYPIPFPHDREGYFGDRHFAYWYSGLYDYLEMAGHLARHGLTLRAGDGVFDLGCASGRTLRHFACQHDEPLDLWGSDIKRHNVEWCQRHLPAPIKVVLGTDYPGLPFEDRSMSLVYAQSVFTHIDDYETAWLAELRRILRPGGMAILTVHSERLWTRMNADAPVYNALLRHKNHPEYPIDPEQFTRPMHSERVVFRMGPALHHVNVFHSDAYLRRVWGRCLELLEIIDEPAKVQAQVVLRKR
ncbi:MAG TPA: class I SAM-dependent methyltransferase [Phycisphaerales bacterium]|nr:class I SAM-dependent methyltransferase [Phycisphaerales bacterium]